MMPIDRLLILILIFTLIIKLLTLQNEVPKPPPKEPRCPRCQALLVRRVHRDICPNCSFYLPLAKSKERK